MKNSIFIIFFACLIFSCKKEKVENPIIEQNGKVWDVLADKPLSGAEVKVVENTGLNDDTLIFNPALSKTKSDSSGDYKILFLPEKGKKYNLIIQKKDFLYTAKNIFFEKACIIDAKELRLGEEFFKQNFMPSGKVNLQFNSKLLSDSMTVIIYQEYNGIKNGIKPIWLGRDLNTVRLLLEKNALITEVIAGIFTKIQWKKSNEANWKEESIKVNTGKTTDFKILW
jgi:hypothetical protein